MVGSAHTAPSFTLIKSICLGDTEPWGVRRLWSLTQRHRRSGKLVLRVRTLASSLWAHGNSRLREVLVKNPRPAFRVTKLRTSRNHRPPPPHTHLALRPLPSFFEGGSTKMTIQSLIQRLLWIVGLMFSLLKVALPFLDPFIGLLYRYNPPSLFGLGQISTHHWGLNITQQNVKWAAVLGHLYSSTACSWPTAGGRLVPSWGGKWQLNSMVTAPLHSHMELTVF